MIDLRTDLLYKEDEICSEDSIDSVAILPLPETRLKIMKTIYLQSRSLSLAFYFLFFNNGCYIIANVLLKTHKI